MPELLTYFSILHPHRFQEMMNQEAKNPDSRQALIHIFLVSLISVLLQVIIRLSQPPIPVTGPVAGPGDIDTSSFPYSMLVFNPVGSLPGILVTLAGGIVLFYISMAILHGIAALFKGKGELGSLIYVSSILQVSLMGVSILLFLVQLALPFISILLAIPSILVSFYSLYLLYKVLRTVYPGLSRVTAVATFIIHILLSFLIFIAYFLARVAIGI